MLVAERHEIIINTITEKGSIRVTELSKMFNLTEETIRRDLEKLELERKLVRIHGGAVALQEGKGDTPYFQRETLNIKEKENIAKTELSFIDEGESILLDASSTSWFIADRKSVV